MILSYSNIFIFKCTMDSYSVKYFVRHEKVTTDDEFIMILLAKEKERPLRFVSITFKVNVRNEKYVSVIH